MMRRGIQTAAGAVGTTTVSGSGTLAITGGANTLTVASSIGTSAAQRSELTLADSMNSTFSSAVYDQSISLTGEAPKGLNGKDAEKKDNDGYISSDESVVESVEEIDEVDISRDIHLSPGVVKLAEGIDVTGIIDNPSRGTGYLEFNPPLQFVSEANPASANNDGILEASSSARLTRDFASMSAQCISVSYEAAIFNGNVTGAIDFKPAGVITLDTSACPIIGAIDNTPGTTDVSDAALIATAEDIIKETDVVLGGLGGVDGADGV